MGAEAVDRVVSALREIMTYVNRGHIEGDCSFCVAALEEGEQALAAYRASTPAPAPSPVDGGAAELLACPFCNSDELSHGHGYPGYADGKHGIVQCHSCDAIMLGDEEDDAIRQWNARVQP